MRIAITGASGNVGTALLRVLTAHGHEVVGIARRPPAPEAFPGVEWRSADLSTDAASALTTAFTGVDAAIHLVWGFQPTHDEAYLERVALGGTRQMLGAASAAGVPHVLHQSSLGAYSAGEGYADETWPTDGIPTSAYSRHKAAAERILDGFEAEHPEVTVTRMRPALIGQRTAASGVLRYTLPSVVPGRAIDLLKVLPLDRDIRLQLVHADDVAEAYRLAIESSTSGAFNLAADPVLTAADLASGLGARHVHLPFPVLRKAADLSWRAHLQQVDAGWLDMARELPLLDAAKARTELGWVPQYDAWQVLEEVVDGIRHAGHDNTPILRRRSLREGLTEAARGRPVAHRHQP
jgi:UDP-glucose 4-epimerase